MLRGFGEWLEEDPRGRLCTMLNRRNYTRNGHDWNPMELESLRGVRIFGRGFAKRGVRTNPPNHPWLRACNGGPKDFQKTEVEGPGFLCGASQYLWLGDVSSVRSTST